MEFIFVLLMAFLVGIVTAFYIVLTIFGILLPILFWVGVGYIVIKLIKRYA